MFSSVLGAVLALILWSLVVWVWMYALRFPAISKANLDPQDMKHPGSLDVLPSGARSVADNYNHLMEQPTIFYAMCFYAAAVGLGTGLMATLAWVYVALRIVHSLVQNIGNNVMIRFSVFSLSTLVLIAMAVKAVIHAHGA